MIFIFSNVFLNLQSYRQQLSTLNEEELRRFEFFVRSKINVHHVKKIIEETARSRSSPQVSDEVQIHINRYMFGYLITVLNITDGYYCSISM